MRQAVGGQISQRAAAEVDDEGQLVLVCQRGEFGFGYGMGEAADGVVAGMHLHQHRRARVDAFREIPEMGAVGGADFDQLGSGAAHDVGHAEGAADFDQFAARDDDLLFLRQGVEQQEHRRGVVVHHRRRLGAGQFTKQFIDDVIAVAAPTGIDVVLQCTGRARGSDQRLHGFFGQRRAAQIGVQHGAGQIEHRAQSGAHFCRDGGFHSGDQ